MSETAQIDMPAGSPGAVEDAQGSLGRVAGGFERSAGILARAQRATGPWKGQARVSFDGRIASHQQAVSAVDHALTAAQGAMRRYHTALKDARTKIRHLKREEEDALDRLRSARLHLADARRRKTDAEQRAAAATLSMGSMTLGATDPIGFAEHAAAQRDIQTAQDDIDTAARRVGHEEGVLRDLRADARRAHQDLTEVENTASAHIRSAAAQLPTVSYPSGVTSPSAYDGTAFGPITTPYSAGRQWNKAMHRARREEKLNETRWLPRDQTERDIAATANYASTATLKDGTVLTGAAAEIYQHRHANAPSLDETASYPGPLGQFAGVVLGGKQIINGNIKGGLFTLGTSGKLPFRGAGTLARGAAKGERAIPHGAPPRGNTPSPTPDATAAKRSSGTTVLGHWPSYVQEGNAGGHRYFSIPSHIYDSMSPEEQWLANKKFLDRTIARGDNVQLSTPFDKARRGSPFRRELQYLIEEHGYRPDPTGGNVLLAP